MKPKHASDCFFFSSRRRHTRYIGDWSSDVCSSDLQVSQSVDRWLSPLHRKANLFWVGSRLNNPIELRLTVLAVANEVHTVIKVSVFHSGIVRNPRLPMPWVGTVKVIADRLQLSNTYDIRFSSRADE